MLTLKFSPRHVALLGLVSAAFAAPAFASTISFGSYSGSTITYDVVSGLNSGQTGTAVVYTGTSPYSTANYATPPAGIQYFTYDNVSTEAVPAGTTNYFTTITGATGTTGTISFIADNAVSVYLNGTLLGSSSQFGSFTTAPIDFGSGVNTLEFSVYNSPYGTDGVTANPTAFAYYGAAATPEPSSLILLGTGLIGAAGAARRRFLKA